MSAQGWFIAFDIVVFILAGALGRLWWLRQVRQIREGPVQHYKSREVKRAQR